MKLTINHKEFGKTLDILRPLFGAKPSMLTTGMALLRTKEGHLYISGNDLENYCCLKRSCSVEQDGECAVSGVRLLNAVKSASEDVTLHLKDSILHFTSGTMKSRFGTLPVSDLTGAPIFEGSLVTMEADELRTAIDQVIPLISHESSKPMLCGVHFDDSTVVATTGRILGYREMNSSLKANATMTESAARLIRELSGPIQFGFTENLFKAQSEDAQVIGALIAGSFPSWRSYMPAVKEAKIHITFNREDMLRAIPRAANVQPVMGRSIVNMEAKEGVLVLSGKDETNDSEDTVSAQVSGAFETGFDAQYMSAILGACTREEVTLHIRDNITPLLIEEGQFQAVIWPIRTK